MRTLRPAFLLALVAFPLAAQDGGGAMVLATPHELQSKALGEQRKVWVHLPDGYESSDDRHPVLLLLDGPDHMLHTAATARHLASNGLIPELILVGVENTDRLRDMTPTRDEDVPMPSQGGAGPFLTFLCDELTPWVDTHYRTRPTRLLIGHSLGGLVAMHALRTRPGFFAGMIAISPSLQWAKQGEVDAIGGWLDTHPSVASSVYITAADETGLVGAAHRAAGLLDVKAPRGLHWKFQHMPEETHMSVPYRSTHDGLRFLFDGWRLEDGAKAYLDGALPGAVASVARARARYGYEYVPKVREQLDIVYHLSEQGEVIAAQRFVADGHLQGCDVPPQIAAMFASVVVGSNAHDGDAERSAQRVELATTFSRMALATNPWQAQARATLRQQGVDVPPAEECELPSEELATYAGEFACGGDVLRVELEAGHLVCAGKQAPSERLFAKAPGEFWTPSGKGVLFREREGRGRSVELVTWERKTFVAVEK